MSGDWERVVYRYDLFLLIPELTPAELIQYGWGPGQVTLDAGARLFYLLQISPLAATANVVMAERLVEHISPQFPNNATNFFNFDGIRLVPAAG
jgi:hypothetical protein